MNMNSYSHWWRCLSSTPLTDVRGSERARGLNARRAEAGGHLLQRDLVNLRNAAFIHAQHLADFLHGHLVGVVKEHDFLIAFRQAFHGAIQSGAQLPPLADAVRLPIRRGWEFNGSAVIQIGKGTRLSDSVPAGISWRHPKRSAIAAAGRCGPAANPARLGIQWERCYPDRKRNTTF